MKDFSYITNSSPAYIESLYREFLNNPGAIDPEMKKFFEGFDFAISHAPINGKPTGVIEAKSTDGKPGDIVSIDWMKEVMAYRLILGYRNKAHLIANTNPIRKRKDRGANIDLDFYGFTESDLDKEFYAGQFLGLGKAALRTILSHLEKCYASSVGVEFKYISDQKKIDWLTNEIEKTMLEPLPLVKKRRALEKLNQGVMFEKFLHTKYVGQKRFSLEGGETTIAALDAIINTA
ncbi:MAG TPA: 2-oxoglutarate dehydrogenase E1 component, partial [Chitinophagaceae bacterium]|nr:2-oxoglutarate dehydrogenase E1 component [Chitinophagaceae bacterium]